MRLRAGPIERDGELWFYYGGRTYPHDSHPDFFPNVFERTSAIGLAKLRLDGYISYDARGKRGILQTRPIRFEDAKRLFVNADVTNGSLKAVVCDVITSDIGSARRGLKYGIGAELDSYTEADSIEMKGIDSTEVQLKWKTTESLPREKDWISLKFILQNASLYSFWSE